MKLTTFDALDELGAYVAALLPSAGVIGCPAGRTPVPVYAAMRSRETSGLTVVMMDEYVTDDFTWVPEDAPHSCRGFAREHIPVATQHTPDPQDVDAYEALIESLGGIDLFILAMGATDGHVAFNPPGSAADSRTRVITLAEETREDNMKTFPSFGSIDEVPHYGVSVGLGTIARHSKRVVMVAHGASKRDAVARTLDLGKFDESWPASIIYECANVDFVVDIAAAP